MELDWLLDSFLGLGRIMFLMILIILPISILTEFFRASSLLGPSGGRPFKLAGAMKLLGMSEKAYFPLLTGVVLGFVYGAGIMIQFIRDGHISYKDRLLITVFMAVCHAIIEDTLLFVPLGVNPMMLVSVRVIGAIIITSIIARFLQDEPSAFSANEIQVGIDNKKKSKSIGQ